MKQEDGNTSDPHEHVRAPPKNNQMLTSSPKELGECTREPPDGMRVKLVDESSIYKWEVLIDGPEQSPYVVRPSSLPRNLPEKQNKQQKKDTTAPTP